MKKITVEQIKKYQNDYANDEVFKVIRRALVKNPLRDITSVIETSNDLNHQFSITLKTLPAVNQFATGRCWLFAGLNVLREQAAKKFNVKNFEFSQSYQAFWDKLEKINFFIESMDDFLDADPDDRTMKFLLSQGIQDGGQWDMFVALVNKYGVVPKDAMPDTHTGKNTGYLNRLIDIQLRKYTQKARELYQNNQAAKIANLKEKTLYELYSLISTTLGIPPQDFSLEYVDNDNNYHLVENLTPQKFYEDLGFDYNDYVSVINAPTADKPYYRNYSVSYLGNVIGGKQINHLNLPMERVQELIINQLKDGEVVWFGCDVSFYGDRAAGIWDDNSYDFDSTFKMDFQMTKKDRLDYLQGAMNHAMVITGVNLVNNQPTKWKIENSYGEEPGQRGYYLMSQSWFLNHTYQAVVNKKYLLSEELKIYDEKPIMLKPWDPIGSLAK